MSIVRTSRDRDAFKHEPPHQGILDIGFLTLEEILQMPKGYYVTAVYSDPEHRGIRVVIESRDLPATPEGDEPVTLPAVDVLVETKKFTDRETRSEDYWHRVSVKWHRYAEEPQSEEE
jgi:hypothetical protein